MLHLEFRRRFRFSVTCDNSKQNAPVNVTFYKLDPERGLVPVSTRPGSKEEWAMYQYITSHENTPMTNAGMERQQLAKKDRERHG